MNAVVSINEETRRVEQYNDIVANIKPLMTAGKRKESENDYRKRSCSVVLLFCGFKVSGNEDT